MFDTRLSYLVVDWERRIQIENEKQGKPQSDKYALFPSVSAPGRKSDKSNLTGLLNSIKTVTSVVKIFWPNLKTN